MMEKHAAEDVRKGDEVSYSDSFARKFATHRPEGLDEDHPGDFCPDCYNNFRNLKGVVLHEPGYGSQAHILWNPQPHHNVEDFNDHEHIWNSDYKSNSFHGVPSAMEANPDTLMSQSHIANEFLEDLEVKGVRGDSKPAGGDWKPEGWDLTAQRIAKMAELHQSQFPAERGAESDSKLAFLNEASYGNGYGRGTGNGYGHYDGAGLSPIPPLDYHLGGGSHDTLDGFWQSYVTEAQGDLDLNAWMQFVYEHNVPLTDHEAIQYFDDNAKMADS